MVALGIQCNLTKKETHKNQTYNLSPHKYTSYYWGPEFEYRKGYSLELGQRDETRPKSFGVMINYLAF